MYKEIGDGNWVEWGELLAFDQNGLQNSTGWKGVYADTTKKVGLMWAFPKFIEFRLMQSGCSQNSLCHMPKDGAEIVDYAIAPRADSFAVLEILPYGYSRIVCIELYNTKSCLLNTIEYINLPLLNWPPMPKAPLVFAAKKLFWSKGGMIVSDNAQSFFLPENMEQREMVVTAASAVRAALLKASSRPEKKAKISNNNNE